MAMCSDDAQQGGWGYMANGIHALVWNGSASSYADLNPSGYSFSYCLGVHNGQQVGYAQNQVYFVTASHAMLWYGSAASAVDLHPSTTYPYSRALGVHDGEQAATSPPLPIRTAIRPAITPRAAPSAGQAPPPAPLIYTPSASTPRRRPAPPARSKAVGVTLPWAPLISTPCFGPAMQPASSICIQPLTQTRRLRP